MTGRERVEAALAFQTADRTPYTIWTHYPGPDFAPAELAAAQVRDALRYGFDFIKVANVGLFMVLDYGTTYARDGAGRPATDRYGTLKTGRYGVADSSQWTSLAALDPDKGFLGDQLDVVRRTRELLRSEGCADLPVVATIYSPLTTAYKLGGDLLLRDMRERPEAIHRALEALTDTSVRYARRCVEAGADGFFFASQLSSYDYMDDEAYGEFGERYDLRVFESFVADTLLNVVHIHGERAMFGRLAAYPANCVNWHDRWIGPSIPEARRRTPKCLLGGIDEERVLGIADEAGFRAHVREALVMGGERGFMLGPGCTAYPNLPDRYPRIVLEELQARERTNL